MTAAAAAAIVLVLVGLAVVATYRAALAQADGLHTERGQARHRHPSAGRARRRDRPTRRVQWPTPKG